MPGLSKAKVTIDGVQLAATSAYGWRFTTGTEPYRTAFTVHKDQWRRLEDKLGKPVTLSITDSRGKRIDIKKAYITRTIPSAKPSIVSFEVADARWRWAYVAVRKDYNVLRRTGDKNYEGSTVPIETATTVDQYDYLTYSLSSVNRERWTAESAVEDVLIEIGKALGEDGDIYRIDSWPLKETENGDRHGELGQFTLQNVSIADSGDVALSRMLSYVPGANIYIDTEGQAVIFDSTDIDGAREYFDSLPPLTWLGDKESDVDLKGIRPKKVQVHYEREFECIFEFADNYRNATSTQLNPDDPFIENVIPTVDPFTTVEEYDPVSRTTSSKRVPPGTWVEVSAWLQAMDDDRPPNSMPWTFETVRTHWLGNLDGVLGAGGKDIDTTANISARVQALKQHFRQTFRINRRYMERTKSLRALRVGILDPITGARANAPVWGQACVIPSRKGQIMASRRNPDEAWIYRNVDMLAPSKGGEKITETAPGPTKVTILDEDIGIIRVDWIESPYGIDQAWIPCNLSDQRGTKTAPKRDLSDQDDGIISPSTITDGRANGLFLAYSLELKLVLSVVALAPNSKNVYHRETVEPSSIKPMFRTNIKLADGEGPDMEVIVQPNETTALYQWDDDQPARDTIKRLLGLTDDEKGIPPEEPLAGFRAINQDTALKAHSQATAASILAQYIDTIEGSVATRILDDPGAIKLVGNMDSATIRVAGAPSGRVDVQHDFSPQTRSVSRFALMPDSVRQVVLGVPPFRG